MSWWWQVDVGGLETDWPRLLFESLGPLAIIVLVMPIAAFLIWFNVKIRRRDVDRQ
jgi:hypothetical protein